MKIVSRFQSARSVALALPGAVTLLIVWLVSFLRLNFREQGEASFQQWQSLGREILDQEGLAALVALHIQPPAFNFLQLINLRLTPTSHMFLAVIYLLMILITLFLVVDSAQSLRVGRKATVLLGLTYAAVPSTVIYALWPMTTTPTALAVAAITWGITRLRRTAIVGAVGIASGTLLAFLFRSSFTWVFCAFLTVGVAFILVRQRKSIPGSVSALLLVGAGLSAVLAVQIHYSSTFGIPTTSSWAGENLAKGLGQSTELSVSKSSLVAFTPGSCEFSLMQAVDSRSIRPWDPTALAALPGCEGILSTEYEPSWALSEAQKDGAYDGSWTGNFNWAPRLTASKVWTEVMMKIVRDDPGQVLEMAVGRVPSGLSIYVEAPENYSFVGQQRVVHPLLPYTGTLSIVLAPVALSSVVVFWIWFAWRRPPRGWPLPALGLLSLLLAYHVGVSLIDYGENNRFQAEVIPLLLVLVTGMLSVVGFTPMSTKSSGGVHSSNDGGTDGAQSIDGLT